MTKPDSLRSEAAALRVGFVGAGKAGTSFGKYIAVRADELGRRDVGLTGFFSRSPDSAKTAAELTGSDAFGSGASLAESSDVIFFSVPDGEIGNAFAELVHRSGREGVDLSDKLFAHLSGSLSSEVFAAADFHGAPHGGDSPIIRSAFSLHPACALPDRENSWVRLREACLVFEGPGEARNRIAPLLELLGNRTGEIAPERKVLYHAACVFLSNFSVALAAEGTDLLKSCGLDAGISSAFLETLFLGNAKNVAEKGPVAALTGPVERGDAGTIKNHLEAISAIGDDTALRAYRDMTKILLRVADEKHPDQNYTGITAIIE
jgi:predicted short-subunit dehydrogenase-like oxidoreductase (DUF2520 family)